MLIGYILEGKALDDQWNPIINRVSDDGSIIGIRFFNEFGRFILDEDEKILVEIQDDKVTIEDDWKGNLWRGSPHYIFKGYLAKGKTIVTNTRLFHFRTPDPFMSWGENANILGMPTAIIQGVKAKKAKDIGLMEFCEMSYNEIVKIRIYPVSITYDVLFNWKRYNIYTNEHKNDYILFKIIEKNLQSKEIKRTTEKNITTICYLDPKELDLSQHWKRDDQLKKAKKYEKREKYEKAIVQYQKILELFPDDGGTKRKIENLSKNKGG